MTSLIQTAFSSSPFALTLFTRDLAASLSFYQDALKLEKLYQDEVSAVFRCGQTVINLLLDSEAIDLVAPAQVSQSFAVRALYTLRCADIDATVAELEAAGVQLLNGPMDRPWGVRTASFQDPSGHTWELANHA
jgi:catechol 2,3-dioxygenase-like lactoylglutathione lyase family enzyme